MKVLVFLFLLVAFLTMACGEDSVVEDPPPSQSPSPSVTMAETNCREKPASERYLALCNCGTEQNIYYTRLGVLSQHNMGMACTCALDIYRVECIETKNGGFKLKNK